MNKKFVIALLAVISIGVAAGCVLKHQQNQKKECSRQLFAMDTVMSFTAYGAKSEEAVEAAIQEVQRLDDLLSTGSQSSEVTALNQAKGGTVSADTAELLWESLRIYERTGGLFDPTIYPLMQLWGFTTGNYHVPTEGELEKTLPLVDASKISTDGASMSMEEGQQIDFGGIAKGYTSARIMGIFEEYEVKSGMVSLGGNIQVYGKKLDGSKWRIGIQDPDTSRGGYIGVVSVEDEAVVTSGGYERYFEEDGNTYIHILDPRNGYPADQDLISVTIVSKDGTLADALSTSLYIMGLEGASEYWRSYGDDFEAVFITDDRELYVTEGLVGDFETSEDYQVITK